MSQENQQLREEYRHIRKDTKKVLIINGVILLVLIGIYFLNQEIGFLDQFLR